MEMKKFEDSTSELARKAREALQKAPPETPKEHFARLVKMGLIDSRGHVTKMFGGEAEPDSGRNGQSSHG